jgi:hypothetical protein
MTIPFYTILKRNNISIFVTSILIFFSSTTFGMNFKNQLNFKENQRYSISSIVVEFQSANQQIYPSELPKLYAVNSDLKQIDKSFIPLVNVAEVKTVTKFNFLPFIIMTFSLLCLVMHQRTMKKK